MSLLSVNNVECRYGTHIVLDGMTLSIEVGERIGLVGRNGTGKTTLMKLIQGLIEPDRGTVQVARSARVGYLSQDPSFDPKETVREAAEAAFDELHALHQQMHKIYDQMASAEGDELDRLMRRQASLEAQVEAAGGYAIDHLIDATLHGLGFSDDQFNQPTGELSGGQKGRLGLARLLLEAPDLLLLDEPTNHLDIDGRRWLETFLADEYTGAVLVVSHDRWLLNRVVQRICEVERGRMYEYPGSYEKYVELRRERQLTEGRQHQKQLDHIRREEQFIRKYKAGQRAKQARGRESRLDRFRSDQLVARSSELDVMRLKLPKAARSGDLVIHAEGISKRFDDLVLFTDFDFQVYRGDRIGIIGPNGVGKTTLIKCLTGDLQPDTGTVTDGSRLSVGYYRQSHDHLDMSLTVWQYLQSVIVSLDGAAKASEQQARDLAGAFLFSGGEQDKTLELLSGGERSRVVLAGLVAGAHNVLVLDEPTNHLDIPSAERLEQAMSAEVGFDGTLLLISHDRALLEVTCDQLLVFDGKGGVRHVRAKYSEFLGGQEREVLEQREQAKVDAREAAQRVKAEAPKPAAKAKPDAKRPHSHLKMDRVEAMIEQIEGQITDLDMQMADPAVFRDGAKIKAMQAEREALREQLGPLEQEWARRAEEA